MSAPVIIWIALIAILVVLFAYRKIVVSSVDELVHVSDVSDAAISKQAITAKKLNQLDRMAKILAGLVIVYGLCLGGLMVYQALMS